MIINKEGAPTVGVPSKPYNPSGPAPVVSVPAGKKPALVNPNGAL